MAVVAAPVASALDRGVGGVESSMEDALDEGRLVGSCVSALASSQQAASFGPHLSERWSCGLPCTAMYWQLIEQPTHHSSPRISGPKL